jgi:hypothetical protein
MRLVALPLVIATLVRATESACAQQATPEPVRVAATCGVSSGYQPVVGRFGLFPPPPLPCAPLPDEAFEPPKGLGPKPAATPGATKSAGDAAKRPVEPPLPEVHHHPPCTDERAILAPCDNGDFSADAFFAPYDACAEQKAYTDKADVCTQRPLVEIGLPFYEAGPLPESSDILGPTNLVQQKFYIYGDYRAALAQSQLVGQEKTELAHRLNLDIDYAFTSTERLHAFVGPFQEDARFMRIEDGKYIEELDLFQADTDTLFFEGDLGQMLGGWEGTYAPIDLPVTIGLIPLLFQNGVWMLDAVVGVAATVPAQNSPWLDWSNYDVTFFAGFDEISSGAFDFDQDAAALVGATTMIEARGGYFELGYGFVDDQEGGGRSYHNVGASYTRRYLNVLSNSVRVITNAGQERGDVRQTADGVLLLVENSLLTENPYNVIPYVNFFAGFDRPQPLARAGAFGGTLFNTGVLFQSDLLTAFPTLDATGNNTCGAAMGLDLIAPGFDQQVIVEVAVLHAMESPEERIAAGDQVGLGARWQKQLSTAHLIRADAMVGMLENSDDIAGARVEYRWKF